MSISSEVRRAGPYSGNGSTTAFAFAFKVFNTSQVQVTRTVSGVETVLTLTTHYTVSLNANQNTNPGGTVTMLTAPAVGQSITITSNVANLQPTAIANLGGFYPEVINDSLDRATIQIQQLDERLDRALVIPVSSSGVSTQLPVPSSSKLIGWDSAGTALQNYNNIPVGSTVYQYVHRTIATAGQTAVALPITYTVGAMALSVFVNGLRVEQGSGLDYVETNSSTITFTSGLAAGDLVVVAIHGDIDAAATPPNYTVESIAALRLLTGTTSATQLILLWNHVAGDGGGIFRYDSTDTTTADNGGTVIVDAAGRRWKRQISFALPASANSIPANGSTDATPGLQAALTATSAAPLQIPEGQYATTGLTAAFPINVQGIGTGAGPGPAAQSNSDVTQLLLSSATSQAITVTSLYPSVIKDFQINVTPAARPQSAGGGIKLQSPAANNTFANAKISNVGITNAYRGVEFVRPSWPTRDGIYVDSWVDAAFYDETSSTAEGLGGFIRGAYLFGTSGSTTQGAAIKSRVGYTTITDAAIIGGSYGLDWSIRDYPAGAHRMGLVQIENVGVASTRYRTVDSTAGSMVHQLGVEFSNVGFADNIVADVLIEADTAPWLDAAVFQNNIHRNLIPSGNTGFSYYDIRSGDGVRVDNAIIHHLAGSTATSKVVKVGAQASRVFVNNPLFFGATITTPYDLTSATTLFDIVNGVTVAQLPTAANGSIAWCSDARPGTAPVESGGTGAFCVRVGGAWNALMSGREIRSNANATQVFTLNNPDVNGLGFELAFAQGASTVHRLRSIYASGDWTYRLMYSSTDLIRLGSTGLNAILVKDSVTPANNGEIAIERTSNTSLTFKLKGTDGTVRTGSITLS